MGKRVVPSLAVEIVNQFMRVNDMNWSKGRLTVYITTFLVAVSTFLVFLGYATFDSETMMLDIAPVNVAWLAGIIAGPVASLLATMAVWFGWKPMKKE